LPNPVAALNKTSRSRAKGLDHGKPERPFEPVSTRRSGEAPYGMRERRSIDMGIVGRPNRPRRGGPPLQQTLSSHPIQNCRRRFWLL